MSVEVSNGSMSIGAEKVTGQRAGGSDRPELLAPAGDWDALRAAVANGADAVYFGLSDFNARHRATNFTREELPQVMQFLHDHNVRGYVTCNTLIFSDELPEIAEYIKSLAIAGADAIIVQDLGLVTLIRKLAPQLTVHGSTQMTLADARGVEFVRKLGIERVILARELSVREIRDISAKTDLPIEVFIHGALCVAYSGQCLTSESLGGRSANRGQCAQACRLPYDLIVDGQQRDLGDLAYLLSPQDLAAPELVDDLIQAGVSCLKIEGRLKSAQYVAVTTQTYRAALDAAIEQRAFTLDREQSLAMQQSFSRGFTPGFLGGINHQELVQGRFPKSRGVLIGQVIQKTRNGVIVELHQQHWPVESTLKSQSTFASPPLKPGDGVVFDESHPDQDEQGGRIVEVAPAGTVHGVPRFELRFHTGSVNLATLTVGCLVWKTDDPALRKRLEQSFNRPIVPHRTTIDARVRAVAGEPLVVEFATSDGFTGRAVSEQLLAVAVKIPLSTATLHEQLARLGDTPYELGEVTLESADGVVRAGDSVPVMVPKSLLNELRRQAIAALRQAQRESARRDLLHPNALEDLRQLAQAALPQPISTDAITTSPGRIPTPAPAPNPSQLAVLVRTVEQLQDVLSWSGDPDGPPVGLVYCDFEEVKRYGQAVELTRAANVPVALATLRVVKPNEDGWLRQIGNLAPEAVLVRNVSALSFYREHFPNLPLLGDYSLNVANELTALLMVNQGLQRLVPSYDLNWQQLQALLQRFPTSYFESVVHQHMPMFHMEHCVFAHMLSNGKDHRDCGRPCDRHKVDLRDRVGESHPLVADVGCRNTLFNAHAQSAAEYIPRMQTLGLRWFRVELLRETKTDVHALLSHYARVIAGKESGRAMWQQLRVLNQLGVTRGPMEFE